MATIRFALEPGEVASLAGATYDRALHLRKLPIKVIGILRENVLTRASPGRNILIRFSSRGETRGANHE